MLKKTIEKTPAKVVKPLVAVVPSSKVHPDYPEYIKVPYPLAHKASRSDRRIKLLLHTQVAEHKDRLKKNK